MKFIDYSSYTLDSVLGSITAKDGIYFGTRCFNNIGQGLEKGESPVLLLGSLSDDYSSIWKE